MSAEASFLKKNGDNNQIGLFIFIIQMDMVGFSNCLLGLLLKFYESRCRFIATFGRERGIT